MDTSDTSKIPAPGQCTEQARTAQQISIHAKSLSTLATLPFNVTISRCTGDHIKSFRRLNALLLPIKYPDSFYKETLENEVVASTTRVALWTPSDELRIVKELPSPILSHQEGGAKVVAGIRCRLLANPPDKPTDNVPVLYISTIGTLAPFRRLSLASHLLEEILQVSDKQYGVPSIYAHVWEANEEAMAWYTKRGFTVVLKEQGYYQKLAPKTDAWLIKRDIG